MSLSSGDAVLNGTQLTYTLTVPLFEVAHTQHPETALLEHIEFVGSRMINHECHPDQPHDSYVCHATYEYRTAPDSLNIRCTYPEVTVPNHIHLLRASNGAKHDQAVFDSAFTNATLRFRPPTATESAIRQLATGAGSVVTGLLPILLLLTLAAAATRGSTAITMPFLFLCGQFAGALLPWAPAPRFLESLAAVSIAYLAFEVLFLSYGTVRLLLAAGLGVVPGVILASTLRASETPLPWAYLGTATADLTIFAAAWAVVWRIPRIRKPVAVAALAISLVWFAVILLRP